jgi:hypothetical protein
VKRKLLVLFAAIGAVLASLAFFRQAGGRGRERVDLYFADGSMVSLNEGPDAEKLLALARTALAAAQ